MSFWYCHHLRLEKILDGPYSLDKSFLVKGEDLPLTVSSPRRGEGHGDRVDGATPCVEPPPPGRPPPPPPSLTLSRPLPRLSATCRRQPGPLATSRYGTRDAPMRADGQTVPSSRARRRPPGGPGQRGRGSPSPGPPFFVFPPRAASPPTTPATRPVSRGTPTADPRPPGRDPRSGASGRSRRGRRGREPRGREPRGRGPRGRAPTTPAATSPVRTPSGRPPGTPIPRTSSPPTPTTRCTAPRPA